MMLCLVSKRRTAFWLRLVLYTYQITSLLKIQCYNTAWFLVRLIEIRPPCCRWLHHCINLVKYFNLIFELSVIIFTELTDITGSFNKSLSICHVSNLVINRSLSIDVACGQPLFHSCCKQLLTVNKGGAVRQMAFHLLGSPGDGGGKANTPTGY